jgi:hypothetical protein
LPKKRHIPTLTKHCDVASARALAVTRRFPCYGRPTQRSAPPHVNERPHIPAKRGAVSPLRHRRCVHSFRSYSHHLVGCRVWRARVVGGARRSQTPSPWQPGRQRRRRRRRGQRRGRWLPVCAHSQERRRRWRGRQSTDYQVLAAVPTPSRVCAPPALAGNRRRRRRQAPAPGGADGGATGGCSGIPG